MIPRYVLLECWCWLYFSVLAAQIFCLLSVVQPRRLPGTDDPSEGLQSGINPLSLPTFWQTSQQLERSHYYVHSSYRVTAQYFYLGRLIEFDEGFVVKKFMQTSEWRLHSKNLYTKSFLLPTHSSTNCESCLSVILSLGKMRPPIWNVKISCDLLPSLLPGLTLSSGNTPVSPSQF